ncbi:MAG TPA: hypothetical protein VF383_12515 [Candidatus Dormibacteraeota bacterium]
MTEEVLFQKGTTLVRRQRLEPGETTGWHVDPYFRVSVVLHGDSLELEYRDNGERKQLRVTPGQVDLDEPTLRPHRALNTGSAYEEVTIFFRDHEDAPHQPAA